MILLSWLAFATGVLGLILAPRWKHGWLIAALASVPWLIYAIPAGLGAVIAQSIVYGIVDTFNYIGVLRARRKT